LIFVFLHQTYLLSITTKKTKKRDTPVLPFGLRIQVRVSSQHLFPFSFQFCNPFSLFTEYDAGFIHEEFLLLFFSPAVNGPKIPVRSFLYRPSFRDPPSPFFIAVIPHVRSGVIP